ncbi:putative ATP-dependent RNA helicase [Bordetella bronchiseptica MO211]|nr:putative ATP-dependent RNA helicase [Bordetella bronchiseptica MO211]
MMGAAQTGTGKTAAFTLPILHRLMPLANTSASPARHPVRALILTPTRELADQVYESVKRYSLHTPLRSAVVFATPRGERRTSGAAAPRQPVDELFYKPYEPADGQPASPEAPKPEGRSNAPKRQLAVLLGGSRKG